MNTIKTRFAPSPTGLMHFGNVRAGLFNYLYAKKHRGHFLLRIEDTDIARSEDQFSRSIVEDLNWLGINWQEGPYYQSQRQDIYEQYYQILEQEKRVYPCFCSEEVLAITRKTQLQRGLPPRYPGTCRNLSAEEVTAKKNQNIPWTLRFQVPVNSTIEFEDLIKGPQRFNSDHIGDFIIRRQDGTASFMFCNAIDDALMAVTHALRGDDHLTNTPRQLLILQAVNLKGPQYGHFPTILGPDSKPLSKRNGSRSIQDLREEGYHPLGILNYLSRLGHYDADMKFLSQEELIQHFDLKNISHSPAHFDPKQLLHWQKEAMLHASVTEVAEMLKPVVHNLIPDTKMSAFVETIQANLFFPQDAKFWGEAFFEEQLDYSEEIKKLFQETNSNLFIKAAELVKSTGTNYSEFITKIQAETGLKGKALFFPIRAALSGVTHGPELAKIFELMGEKRLHQRFLEAAHHATHLQ